MSVSVARHIKRLIADSLSQCGEEFLLPSHICSQYQRPHLVFNLTSQRFRKMFKEVGLVQSCHTCSPMMLLQYSLVLKQNPPDKILCSWNAKLSAAHQGCTYLIEGCKVVVCSN